MNEVTFAKDLEEKLNSSQFYAQPKNTELKLNFGDYDSIIIGNAVVMNIEYTDEKIPVYSYNSDTFEKFLKGKSVITGVIALRKTTVDKIIALFKNKNQSEESQLKIKNIEKELEILEELASESDLNSDSYSFFKEKKADLEYNLKKINEISNANYNKEFDITESNYQGDLLYYNNYTQINNASINICYKDDFIEEVDTITNILFTKKQTDINVGRNDIVEVYHFIGNPYKNSK